MNKTSHKENVIRKPLESNIYINRISELLINNGTVCFRKDRGSGHKRSKPH
jgi:hypothetical protein